MRKLKQNINTSLKPEDRKKANVEVEKGEVVFTKQDPTNNIFELYNAAGKKHSQGGTPLNLPVGDDKGKGSSFIYSDKLKVKDKEVLDFFGFETKKKLTIADIVRPLVGVVNNSKAILLDKNADKISKISAERNLENARFKLDAAKLYQESLKGMEDAPEAQSFFDKTGLEPDKVFGLSQQDQEQAHEAIQKALGGMVRKDFGGDPQIHYYEDEDPTYAQSPFFMAMGGDLPKYERAGTVRRRGGTQIYSSESGPGTVQQWVAKDPANQALNDQANAIINAAIDNKQIVVVNKNKGLIDIKNSFKPSFKDRMILSKVFNQAGPGKLATTSYSINSQQADNVFSFPDANKKSKAGRGSFVGGFTPEMFEQRYFFSKYYAEAKKANKSDTEAYTEAVDKADQHKSDAASRKEFMTYLGADANSDFSSDDYYKNNYKNLTTLIETKFPADKFRKYLGNDGYSGYDHFDAIGYIAPPDKIDTTPLPKKDDTPYDPGKVKGLSPNWNDNPYGFRREDINSLNRAVEAKNDLRMLMPYQAPLDTTSPKVPYYSVERSIANINEQLNQGVSGVKAFSGPQQVTSNITSLYADAYGKAANEISNYSDKNVSQETVNNQQQAQIYNAANAARATSNEGYQDKVNNTMQNFSDSLAKAKDMIVGMKNNALENASGIYNTNTMQEHYKIDPVTGLKYFVTDKNPFEPTTDASTNAYDEYNKAYEKLQDKELALKLVAIQMGKKTDKSLTDEEQNEPTRQ